MNNKQYPLASEIHANEWLNTSQPLLFKDMKDKVVVIHAFQMLCPGCVTHGIPQTSKIYEMYSNDDVQVIGLHSVFEHHQVMNTEALKAFVYEYRLQFPIAIDLPSETSPIPITMENYKLQGTPSLILIDKMGYIRLNHFGQLEDMKVGSMIGQLIAENTTQVKSETSEQGGKPQGNCDKGGCHI